MAKRQLKWINGKIIYSASKQDEPVAACQTCEWRREGKNASGTGVRHAAAKRHVVIVTKLIVTTYDGHTPDLYDNPEDAENALLDTETPAVVE